ncbi:MAG TPA: type II toxin-antitoxin system RelE/ParE family toxin [Verrucomicrobiae bacterium]|nr:type II toxin-antitoxin system RelE/ParE family toxin [Verrucomicrobiae bacterium]
MKRITYLSVAETELTDAAKYYDEQQPGLGREFLDAIKSAQEFIQRNPELPSIYKELVRSRRVKPFSYKLLYRELSDRIQIVAVMHCSRRPDYWQNRIS